MRFDKTKLAYNNSLFLTAFFGFILFLILQKFIFNIKKSEIKKNV